MNKCRVVILMMFLVSATMGLRLTRQHAKSALSVSNLEQRLNWIRQTALELNDGKGSVELYSTSETDDLLAVFANRPDVTSVVTEATDIGQKGLLVLSTLPNLKAISFTGEQLGLLDGLAKCNSLKQLSFNYTDVSGADLAILAKFPSLRTLKVAARWKESERDVAVRALGELKNLERLEIGSWADDSVFEKLREELRGCEVIQVEE